MPLTQQQIEAIRKKYNYTPTQTITQTETPKGVSGAAGVAVGAGKGITSTLTGISSLGERMFGSFAKTLLPNKAEKTLGLEKAPTLGLFGKSTQPTAAETLVPEKLRKPEGTAEKIGFYGEQIGELFIPVPGLGVVGKTTKLAGGSIKLLPKTQKTLKLLSSTAKFAGKEGIELAGKTALQSGGDTLKTFEALIGGAVGGAAGKLLIEPAFKVFAPAIAKTLEKTNLRLTPVQKSNLGKTVDDVADYLSKKKIIGSPTGRLEKINNLYAQQEANLKKFLTSDAVDRTVNKQMYLDQLDKLKMKYAGESNRDIIAIEKQINDAKATIEKLYPEDEIPVLKLNDFKRSTYSNAYNNAGDKVLDSVEHDIADAARLNIESATKGLKVGGQDIGAFNKEYGTLINARKLLKIASTRKEIGLTGKLLITAVGGALGSVGGPMGSAGGMVAAQPVANLVAGTAARSIVSLGLNNLSKMPAQQAEQALIRILTGILNNQSNQ